MTYDQALIAGFRDEFEKIAGELQGATRVGVKPIGVERMLEREREAADAGETPSTIFNVPLPEVMEKVSASAKALVLGGVAAGAGGYHVGRQAVKDHQLGRAIRKQQQAGN